MKNRDLKHGFTLIELLTVLAIVGVLAAILIPAIGNVRKSAQRSACASNLRQLATASKLFLNENRGELIATPFTTGEYWFRQIYPYLDNDEAKKTNAVFQCASHSHALDAFANDGTEWNTISYLLLKGELTWQTYLQIKSPSNEPQFVDANIVATGDYRSNVKFESKVKGSDAEWRHGDGVNVAYWDGSVRYVENPTYDKVFSIRQNNK